MGVVYTATNTINGKVYVGKTLIGKDERWKQHCQNAKYGQQTYFYKAIRKHGPENFRVEIIGFALLEEEVNAIEIDWIAKLEAVNPSKGYNCRAGGEGGIHSEVSLAKMRGRKMSPESIAKRVAKIKGRKQSPEHRAKTSIANLGKKASEESRRKRSENQKRRYAENPWTMPKPSADGLKRISEAAKQRLSTAGARAERAEQLRRYYENHPDKKAAIGIFHSERYKANPWTRPEVTEESRRKMAEAGKRGWVTGSDGVKRRQKSQGV